MKLFSYFILDPLWLILQVKEGLPQNSMSDVNMEDNAMNNFVKSSNSNNQSIETLKKDSNLDQSENCSYHDQMYS